MHVGHICLSVHLSAQFNLRTAGQILMKFGMDVMPLEAALNFFYSRLCNMSQQCGGFMKQKDMTRI
jgi:hypothetical protein